MQLTAVLISAPEGGYTAHNPETQTVSQGATIEEAIENLKEAVTVYLEVFPMGSASPPIVTMITVPEHA